jgi:hypothetical protein
MKKISVFMAVMLCMLACSTPVFAQKPADSKKLLSQQYNLIPNHSTDAQYFEMESRLMNYGLDGTRLGTDVYHLFLRCVPSKDPSKGDEYTCLKFSVQINGNPETTVPSLTNWKYFFSLTPNAKDEKGQVFGIDHAKFENIKDANGTPIPVGNTYHVYNAFIDFHSMYVFCENTGAGNGIQSLRSIGDHVIHAAANSEAPVNLGNQVAEGSKFKNGEVSLLFKGLSLENGKTCALIEYDSGESSFVMKMTPVPNMEVNTKGSSHYWGDIYKDLESGWFQKATLHEMVVSETNVPGMSKLNGVIERSISIKNIKAPVL